MWSTKGICQDYSAEDKASLSFCGLPVQLRCVMHIIAIYWTPTPAEFTEKSDRETLQSWTQHTCCQIRDNEQTSECLAAWWLLIITAHTHIHSQGFTYCVVYLNTGLCRKRQPLLSHLNHQLCQHTNPLPWHPFFTLSLLKRPFFPPPSLLRSVSHLWLSPSSVAMLYFSCITLAFLVSSLLASLSPVSHYICPQTPVSLPLPLRITSSPLRSASIHFPSLICHLVGCLERTLLPVNKWGEMDRMEENERID